MDDFEAKMIDRMARMETKIDGLGITISEMKITARISDEVQQKLQKKIYVWSGIFVTIAFLASKAVEKFLKF